MIFTPHLNIFKMNKAKDLEDITAKLLEDFIKATFVDKYNSVSSSGLTRPSKSQEDVQVDVTEFYQEREIKSLRETKDFLDKNKLNY